MLETASFDLMTLIGQTTSTAPELAEPLIGIASTFELGPPSGTEKTNTSGLVRIKIQLACLLMARGFDNLAIPLIDRLADEGHTAIRDDLIAESRPHYWELIDRGINFLYLPSEQKRCLNHYLQLSALVGIKISDLLRHMPALVSRRGNDH